MGGGAQLSSGRGGAGNFVDSTKSPQLQPQDLQTPTLKTSMVTTGRGGSGNMAKNLDPEETRARQDVQPVARRESHGAQHSGRGGAGNVLKGEEAERADQARQASSDSAVDDKESKEGKEGKDSKESKESKEGKDNKDNKDEPKGLAAKGKALLGLGSKKA